MKNKKINLKYSETCILFSYCSLIESQHKRGDNCSDSSNINFMYVLHKMNIFQFCQLIVE